jgi:hypothetical protein
MSRALGSMLMTLLLVMGTAVPQARSETSPEYKLKAAFLYNFASFIDWPPKAFPTAQSPFVIGVLGDDPFGGALETIAQKKNVNGRPLALKRSHNVDDLKDCHVIFICASEQERLPQILEGLRGLPILTIGDRDDFSRQGGIINFFFDQNKVAFEINAEAAQRAGLKISSQLLKLARLQHATESAKGENK